MFNRYVAFSFDATFSLWFVLAFSSQHANDASVPDRVLAKVVGRADRVCLQYEADDHNMSTGCESPYVDHDNDCDWKICAGGESCGNGKMYSGLLEPTWLAVDETSTEIGWRQKSSPCFGMIKCKSSNFDPIKHCLPATLTEFPDGGGVDHASLGCVQPIVGVAATGCAECSAGNPLPYHKSNENWTWYEEVDCNEML